jgi:hypothetical protein
VGHLGDDLGLGNLCEIERLDTIARPERGLLRPFEVLCSLALAGLREVGSLLDDSLICRKGACWLTLQQWVWLAWQLIVIAATATVTGRVIQLGD